VGPAPAAPRPAGASHRFVYAPPEARIVVGRGVVDADADGPMLEAPLGCGVVIVDDAGRAMPLGAIGRVALAADACVADDAFTMPGVPGRWVRTGERGRWRGARLALCGPRDETLWWQGARLDLDRLAGALARDPAVADAAIVARPSAHAHEPVIHLVARRPLARAALLDAARRRLGAQGRWPHAHVLDRLPRDAAGRLDRDALAQLPVLDDAVAARWQAALESAPGVRRARVLLRPRPPEKRVLHVRALLEDAIAPPDDAMPSDDAAPSDDARAHEARPPAEISGGPLALPDDAPRTLGAALLATAARHPTHGIRCIQDDDRAVHIAYPALVDRARRTLAGLRAAGVAPGDRVILQCDELAAHFVGFWACVLGGMVPLTVAIAPRYDEASAVVQKLWNVWTLLRGPWILHGDALGDALAGVPARMAGPDGAPHPWRLLRAAALAAHPPADALHDAAPSDVAFLQLSSGSTGVPKCIQLTHDGILHHVHGAARANGYAASDRTHSWLPLDHVVPTLTCHLKDVVIGCEQIHVQPARILAAPLRWLDDLAHHRVTHTWSPNFGFKRVTDALADAPERHWDLGALRKAMNAGEQVTEPVVRDWLAALAPFGVEAGVMQPAYGMAEVCTAITYGNDVTLAEQVHRVAKDSLGGRLRFAPSDAPASSALQTFVDAGAPIPGVALRIVDGAGERVETGVIGRVQARGAVVTPGYLANDDANRAAFVGDGWFDTGDLGFLWRGRLTITGRAKEIIIIRGANFYGYEIEDGVAAVDGVAPTWVGAVAVDDPATGSETLAVFFVPDGQLAADAPQDRTDDLGDDEIDLALVQRVRAAVARGFGVSPGRVVPLRSAQFPKTTSGKIQRARLRRDLDAGRFDALLARLDVLLANENTLPAWFYRPLWTPCARPVGGVRRPGHVLLIDGAPDAHAASDLAARVAEALAATGARVVARRAPDPADDDGAGRAEAWDALFDALEADAQASNNADALPIAGVVYLGPTAAPGDDAGSPAATYAGLTAVLGLLQASARRGDRWADARLLHVTAAGADLGDAAAAHALDPARAAAAALLGAAAEELPAREVHHLDLDPAAPGAYARQIVAEWTAPSGALEIAYRDGRRWTRRLAPLDFAAPDAADAPDADASPLLRPGGRYVVTGGLGGIGRQLARWLLDHDADAKLLLVGRTPLDALDADVHRDLARLRRRGAVDIAAVDLTDADALRAVIDVQRARWEAPPDAVFHLAGVFAAAPLVDLAPDDLRRGLRARVEGTRALRAALGPSCPLVVFGSINACFAGAAAGVYGVGNRYLEAFVAAERRRGARSVFHGWSLWNETGMTRGYALKEAGRAQ
ncbi:MAG: AMP-binding protein, partial [Acidobacteriota bacterium]